MSDDLVARLRRSWADRGWTASKKINGMLGEMSEAADELESLRVQLGVAKANVEADFRQMTILQRSLTDTRVELGETKLVLEQTERNAARVIAEAVEVLRPFVTHYASWMDLHNPETQSSTFPRHTFAQLNAASRFIASQEPAEQEK